MGSRAFTIVKIAGIPIRCHWSWLAMLAFVATLLHWLYQRPAGVLGAWVLALAATLLLWASVLLHELGHGLVAQRYGLRVGGITLFALGGATEIAEGTADPVRDLVVALAGPLISLALALLCGLGWWLAPTPVLGLLALHLALTNAAMALFNLLPGYPLDGGRALWATLSYLSDDEIGAARVAALSGSACGGAMLLAGLLYALGSGDLVNAAWMGVVGYFLLRSAKLGYRRFIIRRTLNNVSVSDLMQRAFRAVAPDLPLDQFVGAYVLSQVDQGFPVLPRPDTNAPQPLLGMITVRNLRRFQFHEWAGTRVGEAMTPLSRLCLLAPETSAAEAFSTLLESGEEQLPVIDGGALLGLLRRRDLLGYIERQRQTLG